MHAYLKDAGSKGRGLYATRDLKCGDFVLDFIGTTIPLKQATVLSLQIDDDLALESTAQIDDFLNHSCCPNCKVVVVDSKVYLVAVRDIKKDEELSFDYNTTEFDMVEQGCSFLCDCGSDGCLGEVKGLRTVVNKSTEI